MSSSGRGNADLIVPLELLVPHNGDLGNMCMEFYYRIRGGSLNVYQVTNAKGYRKESKLRLSDSQGSWKKARMTFRASQKYHLLLRATPSSGSVDIDNVRFCDTCN
ncbi:keratin, type II cytoskeletal 1-like [Paramuricea clavata]|uniref:Keratin, type II cytoskeletal 1-like n=2 Tax=Paramuricea clavata TaxID=317549 RepID=A0A6S7KPU5_PARCT|nr:keratin, type II cytoskeletal 1-like [Paramuricea clavata]